MTLPIFSDFSKNFVNPRSIGSYTTISAQKNQRIVSFGCWGDGPLDYFQFLLIFISIVRFFSNEFSKLDSSLSRSLVTHNQLVNVFDFFPDRGNRLLGGRRPRGVLLPINAPGGCGKRHMWRWRRRTFGSGRAGLASAEPGHVASRNRAAQRNQRRMDRHQRRRPGGTGLDCHQDASRSGHGFIVRPICISFELNASVIGMFVKV